ncbi:benzoate 4-monooxygenase [Aspergillus indologenus CBS 114.80]|uniref:Benzoate 4-monooxygenase n=1 Tax=Aspergillus indologenus CBS 114.80 TaxID=1450541 RepID=A0A2V5HXM1_9EURO|nr:benzoate 4-monooxygenase [Aspergillus indologenus CBS 114.80]
MAIDVVSSSSIALGILAHQTLFRRGDWELYGKTIFEISSTVLVLAAWALWRLEEAPWSMVAVIQSLRSLGIYAGSFLLGLYGSLIVYRLGFHPLRRFPGPYAAKLSAFWLVFPGGQTARRLRRLHQVHGDFVRIRPREISISHPDAVQAVHGVHSACLRGPFYDVTHPSRSLLMTRDVAFHSQRRKAWDRGLGTAALSRYMKGLLENQAVFMTRLNDALDRSLDITTLASLAAYDCMGEAVFGMKFQTMQREDGREILQEKQDAKLMTGIVGFVPWSFVFIAYLPFVSFRSRLQELYSQMLQRRRNAKTQLPDLYSYLLQQQETGKGNVKLQDQDMVADCELALTAGSETVAVTMACMFYLLAQNPDKRRALQEEMDRVFGESNTPEHVYQDLATAPFLQGCIKETLRLYPPTVSGQQRLTPPAGTKIAGRWIPGDTIVTTPIYAIQRDPRNFIDPDRFVPERWSSKPEMVLRRDAFFPFSMGRFSCAGRALAMMELTVLMSSAVRSFDFTLAPDTSVEAGKFQEDVPFLDFLTISLPSIHLVFTRRGDSLLEI